MRTKRTGTGITVTIEQLGDHDRSLFDCGVPELNDYLRFHINQDRKKRISVPYVMVVDGTRELVGYYTLSSLSLPAESISKEFVKRVPYDTVPSILIGRLAVDNRRQGQGFGGVLLAEALSHCRTISREIGSRFVVVDAINQTAKRFYKAHGLYELLDDPLRLFLPIATIPEE